MHISKKLEQARKEGQVRFSFEYFPPKTAQGVQNLYDRMDRMHDLGPSFVDVTWGAGGSSSDLTTEMVKGHNRLMDLRLACILHVPICLRAR